MPPEEIIREPRQVAALPKVASRVDGLDVVLHGGFPAGRTTLIWGGPGCWQEPPQLWNSSIAGPLAGEPGLLVAFEEARRGRAPECPNPRLGLGVPGSRPAGSLVLEWHTRTLPLVPHWRFRPREPCWQSSDGEARRLRGPAGGARRRRRSDPPFSRTRPRANARSSTRSAGGWAAQAADRLADHEDGRRRSEASPELCLS